MTTYAPMKPCPFCGGNAYIVLYAPEYWVRCDVCKASSDTTSDANRAIEKWNTRSGDETKSALLSVAPELLAFVAEIARVNPVFVKGRERQRIAEARALVEKAGAA